jgi:hypothetical protein
MKAFKLKSAAAALLASGILVASAAEAAPVSLTFSNLAGTNGVALTRFWAFFHNGSFDGFNAGSAASMGIRNIAEAGNGTLMATNFASNFPTGISAVVPATVNAFGNGVYLPGASGSMTFNLDPVENRYLSYFSMVVPSNDRFLGNDSPTEIELFDSQGNFIPALHVDNGNTIWDSGTEVDGTFGAAFVAGSTTADRIADNGDIASNVDFSVYNGFQTPAGYSFTNLPTNSSPLLQIKVAAVPTPSVLALFAAALPFLGVFKRRQSA